MTEPEGSPEGPEIERLVRASLDRGAERVDPRPLFEKILADSRGTRPPPAPARGRRRGRWGWAGAAAAAILLVAGTLFSLQDRKAIAKAEAVVRQAREAHLQPVDRCYLVEVRRESTLAADLAPDLPQVRQTRLWTRGDRFWVESVRPEQRWAWGRDQDGRFWIAFGPRSAVRYEADEVPDGLNLVCDVLTLNVEGWLGEMLGRFDLAREEATIAGDASTIRVKARARKVARVGPAIASAELEIDAETRVVRRMVVRRVWGGEPLATVTYSLAETGSLDPDAYQAEGHVADPSAISTRDHEPRRRKELLALWLGNRPGRWLRALEQLKRP